MTGKISSGQLCTIEPMEDGKDPVKGDIVLCKVKGSQYLHIVSAINGPRYQISNNHGRVNGWINRSNIFGILTRVE